MTAANTKSHDEIGCLSVPLFEKWLGLGGCLWLETRALFSDQQPSRYIGDEELGQRIQNQLLGICRQDSQNLKANR